MHTDHSDFEQLFKKHNKGLCDLAFNLVRDKDAAKDIVQEVFLKLWKNRSNVDLEDQIKHYLFKATAHTSLNHLRFSKKIVKLDDQLNHATAAQGMDEIGYTELEVKAREAIDRLPPKCKAIYLLSRHEGLKYQEIADSLNLSLKTVENQMGIALEKLRTDLKPFLLPDLLVITIIVGLILYSIFH
jgi:RNA polymerase sigma-70 factor (ECF subfamily)